MSDLTKENKLHTQMYYWSLIFLNSASFLLNCLVVLILVCFRQRFFSRRDSLRNHKRTVANHNKLLLSMASADLMVGFAGLITGILLKTGQERLIYKLCGTIPMIGAMLASLLSLVFTTVDQLLAVKFPFRYNRYLTSSRVTKIIIISWMLPAVITVTQMVVYLKTDSKTELKVRNADFAVFFLIGFVFLIISNYCLLQEVKTHHRSLARLSGNSQSLSQEKTCANQSETNNSTPVHLSPSVQYEGEKMSSFSLSVQLARKNLSPVKRDIASSLTNVRLDDFGLNKRSKTLSLSFKTLFNIPNENSSLTQSANSKFSSQSCGLQVMKANHVKTTNGNIIGISRKPSALSLKAQNVRERKIRIMCIWIIFLFLICWLPQICYRFSYVLGRKYGIPWLRRLTQCLALLNSLLNPCIYFLMRSDFRQVLKQLVCLRRKQI